MSHDIAETDANLTEIARLRAELAAATARADAAERAYHLLLANHRALEALYRTMTERAMAAEARIARAAEHLPGRPDLAELVLSEGVAHGHL